MFGSLCFEKYNMGIIIIILIPFDEYNLSPFLFISFTFKIYIFVLPVDIYLWPLTLLTVPERKRNSTDLNINIVNALIHGTGHLK